MDLNGSSAIATLSFSGLNRLLAMQAGALLQNFSGSGTDPATGNGYTIAGAFGPWTVASGGAGPMLQLQLPVVGGLFTLGGVTNDFAGTTLVVATPLTVVPVGGGTEVRLAFAGPGGNPGALSMVACSNGTLAGLPEAMLECLRGQAAQVNFVVARVSGGSAAPFAQPVVEIQQPPGAAEPCVAIFGLTPGAPAQVPAGLVSPMFPASVALAQEGLVQQIFVPALNSLWGGAGFAGSGFGGSAGAVSLGSPFNAPALQIGGRSYQPTIESLNVELVGGTLTAQVSGTCDLNLPGASVGFQAGMTNAINYDAAAGILVISPAGGSTFQSNQQIPWYDTLIGAAVVAAGIEGGLRGQTLPWIEANLSSQLGAAITAMGGLRVFSDSVAWGGAAPFTPQSGAVDGVLLLQGTTS